MTWHAPWARGLTGKVTTLDAKTGKPRTVIDIAKAAELCVSEESRDGLRIRKYRGSPDSTPRSFGQSSSQVGPVDLMIFGQKGSLFFTRPNSIPMRKKRKQSSDLLAMAQDLFDVVLSGAVKIEINQSHPLKDAAQAHRDLESRKTVGSTVLTV